MRGLGVNIEIAVDRTKLLATLKTNLAEHKRIVKEAEKGYLAAAQEDLLSRIKKLKKGKLVELRFDRQVPRSYANVYEQLIRMLEYSEQDLITIDAEQFRHIVDDDWEWMRGFLATSSQYSSLAMEKMNRA